MITMLPETEKEKREQKEEFVRTELTKSAARYLHMKGVFPLKGLKGAERASREGCIMPKELALAVAVSMGWPWEDELTRICKEAERNWILIKDVYG